MKRRALVRTMAASGTALLAGCGFLQKPPLGKVDVNFVDVRTPDVGATSVTIPIVLEFHNPTNQSIPDISGDFDFLINEERIATDELTVNKLEPGERTPYQSDVLVKYADTTETVLNLIRQGSFSAKIELNLNAGGASTSMTASTSDI